MKKYVASVKMGGTSCKRPFGFTSVSNMLKYIRGEICGGTNVYEIVCYTREAYDEVLAFAESFEEYNPNVAYAILPNPYFYEKVVPVYFKDEAKTFKKFVESKDLSVGRMIDVLNCIAPKLCDCIVKRNALCEYIRELLGTGKTKNLVEVYEENLNAKYFILDKKENIAHPVNSVEDLITELNFPKEMMDWII